MPVTPQRLAHRENGVVGVGVTIVILRTMGANERAELREMINGGNGDGDNGDYQINVGAAGVVFDIVAPNSIIFAAFQRVNLDVFAEGGDLIEFQVSIANADPGDLSIYGVLYT